MRSLKYSERNKKAKGLKAEAQGTQTFVDSVKLWEWAKETKKKNSQGERKSEGKLLQKVRGKRHETKAHTL